MTTKLTDHTRFLKRNYCITAHLAERLDELQDLDADGTLKETIAATVNLLEQHLTHVNEASASLNLVMSCAENEPLVSFLENLFAAVRNYNIGFSALALLDYISAAGALVQESIKLANLSLSQLPGVNFTGHQFDSSADLLALKTLLQDSTIYA